MRGLVKLVLVGVFAAGSAQAISLDTVCLIDHWNTLLAPQPVVTAYLDSLQMETRGSCDSVIFSTRNFLGQTLPMAVPVAWLTKANSCSLKLYILSRPDTFFNVCQVSVKSVGRARQADFPALAVSGTQGRTIELFYQISPNQTASISVLNPGGRKIKQFSGLGGQGKVEWTPQRVASGRYLFVLRTGDQIKSVPFVIRQ